MTRFVPGRTLRRYRAPPSSTVSRTSLRRVIPSFTVEVRRRPRLATNSSQDVQSLETRTRPTAFEREPHRLAAATFEAKTSNQPSGDGAASYPKRRILESLVPGKPPPVGRLEDELLSAATSNPKSRARKPRKPPSVRARKGKDQTSQLPRNLESSSDLTARLAERPSVASVQTTGMSPSDATAVSSGSPTATANRIVRNSGGSAPRSKAKRRVQIPLALDDILATVSAKDQRSTSRTDSLKALPTGVDDVSRPNRKRRRTIMGRYVFGDELKPGERWKRRLSKGAMRRAKIIDGGNGLGFAVWRS